MGGREGWGRGPYLLYVELEQKMFSKLVLYLHIFQFSSFLIMFPLITWKYLSFHETNKENCVSGHYILKLGGCFTATIPIYNWIVSIPLEAVTLEQLFRWYQTWLGCIWQQEETFSSLGSLKSCDVIQFCHKNCFFRAKSQKYTLGNLALKCQFLLQDLLFETFYLRWGALDR